MRASDVETNAVSVDHAAGKGAGRGAEEAATR